MHELDALGAPGFAGIELASLSDAGRVRPENQDAVALLENTSHERILLVADGMGGHRGGETASRICLQMVERIFREQHGTPEERLRRGLELANEEIYSHALANPELRGMGTTVVAVMLVPTGEAWLAWVGDSRCYRLRDGALEQVTQDHSLMTEWISIGVISAEAAKTHPRRHELTRALGQSPDVVLEVHPLEVRPGDRLLLCSDGLHGYLSDREIEVALAATAPERATRALVDAANGIGGSDNVSVVVALLPEAPAPTPAIAPEIPQCAPEIAAELALPASVETMELPDQASETSFADLGAELSEADEPIAEPSVGECVVEPEIAVEDPSEQASVLGGEPEAVFAPLSTREIQIPMMTPIRPRRRLDLTSLTVGVASTLLILGLGFGIWSYTTARRVAPIATAERLKPAPAVVQPSKPAPRPQAPPQPVKPVARREALPAAKPEPAKPAAKLEPAKPAAKPAPAPVPTPRSVRPSQPPAARAASPAPSPRPLQSAAPPATAAGFELAPEVERFLDEWLAALETNDRSLLAALGFSNEPAAFAGAPGSRDGFRLVAAEVDEERSSGGRVYLRLVVSYAFRDATGRFRTQDEQRLILHDAAGGLRFEGRWQQ